METKQIIAIIAVIGLAMAGIGAAFAYQATLSNTANTVESDYLALSAAGDFTGAFSYKEDDSVSSMKWNTYATSQYTGDFIPLLYTPSQTPGERGTYSEPTAEILDGRKAVEIGSPYTIEIDSTGMNTDDRFVFGVRTLAADGSTAVDMQGMYYMKITYGGMTSYVPMSNATENTEAFPAEAGQPTIIPLLVSDYIPATGYLSVQVQLVAVEFEGYLQDITEPAHSKTVPVDFTDVTFQFKAIAKQKADAATGATVSITDGTNPVTTATNLLAFSKTGTYDDDANDTTAEVAYYYGAIYDFALIYGESAYNKVTDIDNGTYYVEVFVNGYQPMTAPAPLTVSDGAGSVEITLTAGS